MDYIKETLEKELERTDNHMKAAHEEISRLTKELEEEAKELDKLTKKQIALMQEIERR